MTADDTISFTVNVKNTGTREGQEVVQLYISDKKFSLPRPVKELKAFQKVRLAPGEEKAVTLTIDKMSVMAICNMLIVNVLPGVNSLIIRY